MNTKKIKVVQLYRKGLNQRQIAKQEGLTEKTVGLWLKSQKQSKKDNLANLEALEERLKILVNDKTTPIQDIKDLTTIIKQLEARFFN
jgi:transposase